MSGSPDRQARSKPWVNWCADRITDPVVRLRFLKAVAPPPQLGAPAGLRRLIPLVIPRVFGVLLAALFLMQAGGRVPPPPVLARPHHRFPVVDNRPFPEVWQVESSGGLETYSNGLRIDNRFIVSNHPRSYLAFPLEHPERSSGIRRAEPAGIVFHATESPQAPFEAKQNGVLKKIGESLLEYVRRKRAYHFVIDRFGRVFRVVAEGDAANHASNSVWSDDRWLYINLNQSFLGISLEARTTPGQPNPETSPAQLRAAAMLTEMLRSRYHIAAGNCVAHAQVSVNPSNMQVGYHTDWISNFPFEALGLPENYARPLPALWAFGFEYSPDYRNWAGDRLGVGLERGEEYLTERAADSGLALRAYRKLLQKQYRQELERVRRANAAQDEEAE